MVAAADNASEVPGLVYADLEGPGYTRKRWGRGFSYLLPDGKRLTDRSEIEWCKSLVIPPAWRNVWISTEHRAHILSTGVDDRSRKQYLYHPEWLSYRNLAKFEGLTDFVRRLGHIREAVEADLARRRVSRRRVIAAAVCLIDEGLIRVGNETYRRSNRTFGATTLEERHIEVDDAVLKLEFTGKSGSRRQVLIEHPRLAKALGSCQELPGQRLFQYRNHKGTCVPVTSTDVNDYLRDIAGIDITAKDFRTWGGTVACYRFAIDATRHGSRKPSVAAARRAAEVLGNTLAVARRYYIHPALLEAIDEDRLPKRARRCRKGLDRDETTVARFLEKLK